MFISNIKLGEKCDLSDLDCGTDVAAREGGLSMSATINLL